MKNQNILKSNRTNKWLATGILAIVAILVSSALMMAVLKSKVEVPQSVAQVEQRDIFDAKGIIKKELQNAQMQLVDLQSNATTRSTLSQQEVEVINKYNDLFFARLYDIIDNSQDEQQVVDALFEQFGDYEFSLLNSALEQLSQEHSYASDDNQPKWVTYLGIGFWFKISHLAGFLAGELIMLIPEVSALVTKCVAAAGPAAAVLGAILGAALGALIGRVISEAIQWFLDKIGFGNYNEHWLEGTLFKLDAWWNPINWQYTIDITWVADTILGR